MLKIFILNNLKSHSNRAQQGFKRIGSLYVQTRLKTLVENVWTFEKSTGVVMVVSFQATDHMLDGGRLFTCHPGNQENGEAFSGHVCLSWALVDKNRDIKAHLCEQMHCKIVVLCNQSSVNIVLSYLPLTSKHPSKPMFIPAAGQCSSVWKILLFITIPQHSK